MDPRLLTFVAGFLSGFLAAGLMWSRTLFTCVLIFMATALGSLLVHVYNFYVITLRSSVASQAPCTYTALRKVKDPRFLPLPDCSWG